MNSMASNILQGLLYTDTDANVNDTDANTDNYDDVTSVEHWPNQPKNQVP